MSTGTHEPAPEPSVGKTVSGFVGILVSLGAMALDLFFSLWLHMYFLFLLGKRFTHSRTHFPRFPSRWRATIWVSGRWAKCFFVSSQQAGFIYIFLSLPFMATIFQRSGLKPKFSMKTKKRSKQFQLLIKSCIFLRLELCPIFRHQNRAFRLEAKKTQPFLFFGGRKGRRRKSETMTVF